MTAVAGAAATGAGAATTGVGSAVFLATFALGAAAAGAAATGAAETGAGATSTATFLETVFVVFVAAGVAELIITDAVEVFMAGIRSTGAAGDSILGQGV